MMRIAFLVLVTSLSAGSAFAQNPVARGQQEFVDSKCTVCHLVGAQGNKKGPVLDGVGAKLTPEEIRQWITNAPEMAAKAKIDRKPPMKAYADFPKDKVDALVAYLSSLKK
jgi:cytochrome c2